LTKTKKSYYLALSYLTTAAIIWGLSFTLVRWTLESFTTTQLLFVRFTLAFLIGEVLLYFFDRKQFRESHSDIRHSKIPGIALGLSLITQTYGLNFTTATNSGFITTLYVVMIPFVAFAMFRHKINYRHLILAILAFAGMGMMLNITEMDASSFISSMNKGDLITLIAALTAAVQILFISQVSGQIKNAFRYNTYQSFWTLLTVVPFYVFEIYHSGSGFLPVNPSSKAVLSLLGLTILVSLIAFSLQVLAQKQLSATTSSMLCLLEAPFAFIFAAIYLSETLNTSQSIGAMVILFCAGLTVFYDRPKNAET
jgi:drug/metabolite transporter (DMT)-like permease